MTFLQSFLKSFHNFRYLASSRFQPVTKSIIHVLVFALISCLPFIILLSMTLTDGVRQMQTILTNDIPSFSLKNGALEVSNSSVYLNEDLIDGVFIIDPLNSYKDEELFLKGEGIVLRSHELIVFNYGVSQSVSYSLLGVQELSKDELLTKVSNLHGFLPLLLIIIGVFIYSGLTGIAFISITGIATLGLLLRGRRKSLHYRHLWLMTAYSATLPVVAFSWVDTFAISIHPLFLVIGVLTMLYFAIRRTPLPKLRKKKGR
ncbi:DUF1189 domain-containing protein [Bacillus solitudinis]|uniref:DUF1189 domain-containing protein n=1 Tax=Bacillus solitudinis TaxID=2014074 RepID=UPI0012FE130D|nr:DUF1189 domain-containing protein [Bacillus solitudinis]